MISVNHVRALVAILCAVLAALCCVPRCDSDTHARSTYKLDHKGPGANERTSPIHDGLALRLIRRTRGGCSGGRCG